MAESWSSSEFDVFEIIITYLQEKGRWKEIAPIFRQLNKHWRGLVDRHSLTLRMDRLPGYPICKDLHTILENNRPTAFIAFPQYGRIFSAKNLRIPDVFSRLFHLSLNKIDNGGDAIKDFCPISEQIRFLKLYRVKLGKDGPLKLNNFTGLKTLVLESLIEDEWDGSPSFSIPSLETLTIVECHSLTKLDFLSGVLELKHFQLSDRRINSFSLNPVTQLTKLESLTASGLFRDTTGALRLKEMKLLSRVDLFTDVMDLDLILDDAESVEHLTARRLTTERLNRVSHGPDEIPNTPGSARGMFASDVWNIHFPKTVMNSLRSLCLYYSALDWTHFALLADCPHLELLKTHWCRLEPPSDESLKNLKFSKLKVWASDSNMMPCTVASASMPELTTLGIRTTIAVQESELSKLYALDKLRGLMFDFSPFDGEDKGLMLDWCLKNVSAFKKLDHVGFREPDAAGRREIEETIPKFLDRGVEVVEDTDIFL